MRVVYAEHFKFKGTKEFRLKRAEDEKKQTEDPAAKFSVLVRAQTSKKKISTIVLPSDPIHVRRSSSRISSTSIKD